VRCTVGSEQFVSPHETTSSNSMTLILFCNRRISPRWDLDFVGSEIATIAGEENLVGVELVAEQRDFHNFRVLDSVMNTRMICDIVFHELRIAESVVHTQMNCDARRVLEEMGLAIVGSSILEVREWFDTG
jgi:hypothetical protein